MKSKIAFIIAMLGTVGILGIATAAVATGTNSNSNTNVNTNVPVTQLTWGQLKCLYRGGTTREMCLGTTKIATIGENKNSE